MKSFRTNANLAKNKERDLGYAFGNQQGRASVTSSFLPIWVNGLFKPPSVKLIDGRSELHSGLDIISKLDIVLEFGDNESVLGMGALRNDDL